MTEPDERAKLMVHRVVLTGSYQTLKSLISRLEYERDEIEEEIQRISKRMESFEPPVQVL